MKLNKIEYARLYSEVVRLNSSIIKQALKIRSLSNEIDKLTDELQGLNFYVLDGAYSLYDFRYELLECGVPVEKVDTLDIVAFPQKNKTIAGNREDIAKMNEQAKKAAGYNSDLDKLKNDAETFKRKVKALDKQTNALTPNFFDDWGFTTDQVKIFKESIEVVKELAEHI